MPEDTAVVDPARRVFELSASQIGRRIDAAAKAAGLGEGFTGHSGRVGMGPGPGGLRGGAAGADDRRTVEEFQDAGKVH